MAAGGDRTVIRPGLGAGRSAGWQKLLAGRKTGHLAAWSFGTSFVFLAKTAEEAPCTEKYGRDAAPSNSTVMSAPKDTAEIRLDVWLDVACLFRTRSEAQKACKGGKVEVNGTSAKPHRLMRPGDRIRITRPFGSKQSLAVRVLADRHIPKTEARALYEDTTPPLSPEEIELRRVERAYRAAATAAGPPDRRERRRLRKLKGF